MTQEVKEDFYLSDNNCRDRLIEEWKKHGKLIVAFDFDNTVFDYSKNDNSCSSVIQALRMCREAGFHLVVFTSCNPDRIPEIEDYLQNNDIPYDAINETPAYIPWQGRKVYYNILLDDRAGLSSALHILRNVLYTVRGMKSTANLPDMG